LDVVSPSVSTTSMRGSTLSRVRPSNPLNHKWMKGYAIYSGTRLLGFLSAETKWQALALAKGKYYQVSPQSIVARVRHY